MVSICTVSSEPSGETRTAASEALGAIWQAPLQRIKSIDQWQAVVAQIRFN